MAAEENKSSWIVDSTLETFAADVIERSQELPVVVDFWATWCQPCKMLGPILEKVTNDYAGKFVLVKVDIDQMQSVAEQFGVSSVPTVLAFVNGEPVDGFQGLAPEENFKEWADGLLLAGEIRSAQDNEGEDPAGAEAVYRRALELSPNDTSFLVGVGRCLLAQSKVEEAKEILKKLEADDIVDEEVEAFRAKLGLGEHRDEDVEQLRQQALDAPDDLAQQKRLADALASKGEFEESLDICLRLVESDPSGIGNDARLLMLDVFRTLPDSSEIVKTYRGRLTALLF